MESFGYDFRTGQMYMDLIDDLGTDLALAFLVERKHRQKIDSEDIPGLINRIKASLQIVSHKQNSRLDATRTGQNTKTFSH